MHLKTKESEWSSILESELWRSFQENEDVLSVLKLSYYHLPTYLRQCFTYCAMFPKYYEFNKETLIRLWIAQGYIVCSSKDGDLEDVGDQYFKELLSRSFFHLSEKMSHYKVHDLIHDLAQSIAKDRCMPIGLGKLTCLRHLSDFVVAWDEGSLGAMLNELNGLNQLRGKIVLRNLKNVENVELESKQLILREKKRLQSLELRWIRNYTWYVAEDPADIVEVEKSELLLQKLEPHQIYNT
ncbi:hypothetical protein GH714_034492 [Hevea brasiliensis]|uniref:NB-ARC domain-containing protein n=1 Tax=Hevea brasiliensis TaxID=3981 RepID=A0A6A6N4M9_HEVBR|nr:hypothetical protein GH714_034492 [Hevea brasiliensis]